MKKVFAILLILAGSLAILDNLHIFSVQPLMDYLWPSFLIVLGLSGLFGKARNILFSIVLIVIGSFFLMDHLGWLVNIRVTQLLWPSLLVVVGVYLLMPKSSSGPKVDIQYDSNPSQAKSGEKTFHESNRKEYTAIMGGLEERIISNDFKSVSVTALMGGADLDLRQIQLADNEATIEITAIMGGVDVWLPRGYRIEVDGTPLLGGFENHCESDPNATKTIRVHYAAVMGGIEIKH